MDYNKALKCLLIDLGYKQEFWDVYSNKSQYRIDLSSNNYVVVYKDYILHRRYDTKEYYDMMVVEMRKNKIKKIVDGLRK